MSLIYRSLEQLRRQQATSEPGAMPTQVLKPKRSSRMRKIAALMAGAFLLLGVGLMGVVWYFGDDVSMIARKQPTGVGMVDAARAKREAQQSRDTEKEARMKAVEEERVKAEARAKAEAQERALAELEARRKAKEEVERKAKEAQADLEAQAALAALDAPAAAPGYSGNSAPPPPRGAGGQAAQPQALDRDRALDMHFASQAQRNMRIHSIERSLNAVAKTQTTDSLQKQVSELTNLVGDESPAAYKWKGFMAMKQHRYSTAVKHLSTALALAPDNLETRYNLTLALVRTEQMDKARRIFAPLMEKHNEDTRIRALASYLAAVGSGRP